MRKVLIVFLLLLPVHASADTFVEVAKFDTILVATDIVDSTIFTSPGTPADMERSDNITIGVYSLETQELLSYEEIKHNSTIQIDFTIDMVIEDQVIYLLCKIGKISSMVLMLDMNFELLKYYEYEALYRGIERSNGITYVYHQEPDETGFTLYELHDDLSLGNGKEYFQQINIVSGVSIEEIEIINNTIYAYFPTDIQSGSRGREVTYPGGFYKADLETQAVSGEFTADYTYDNFEQGVRVNMISDNKNQLYMIHQRAVFSIDLSDSSFTESANTSLIGLLGIFIITINRKRITVNYTN
ncbi:MAG: hypothetical protein INQ03_09175 [Candidatus Heimdallarchaeota archaeon]|nr:hypothetical protein [Candidatus Heimdallarchaeota archaeon]